MPKRNGRGRRLAPLAGPVDVPQLVRVVPQLAPETLHQLIQALRTRRLCRDRRRGDTSAVGVGASTSICGGSAQPGRDERFDAERFGEWLELLVDAGDTVAARTVAAMDEHLVVAGLSRHVRVFDLAAIATTRRG